MISSLFINKDYEIILDVDLKYLENLYYCNLLPKSYNSVQTIVLMIGGVFWILTYIFIISKGFRDKTFGMPFFALCKYIMGVCFCICYSSFTTPIVHKLSLVWIRHDNCFSAFEIRQK